VKAISGQNLRTKAVALLPPWGLRDRPPRRNASVIASPLADPAGRRRFSDPVAAISRALKIHEQRHYRINAASTADAVAAPLVGLNSRIEAVNPPYQAIGYDYPRFFG